MSGYVDTSINRDDWVPLAVNDFASLDIAFEGTGATVWNSEPNTTKWQPSGPFRGSFSGVWVSGDFTGQGAAANLLSAAAVPGQPHFAFGAAFGPGFVGPGNGEVYRTIGMGVRCLLGVAVNNDSTSALLASLG